MTCKNNKNEEISYIGMTKRKIKERLKEHIRELKYYNQTTALARVNIATLIKDNTISIEKIANYEGLHNALIRETIKIIISNCKIEIEYA